MNRPSLHQFDLQLCEYIVGNIAGHAKFQLFASDLRQNFDAPILRLLRLCEGDDDWDEEYLLSREEIDDLEFVIDSLADRFRLEWLPYEHLHRRRIACVGEIRSHLTIQDAEDWSRRSAEFAEKLERPRLPMRDGIIITGEWIFETRRYLSAMGRNDLLPASKAFFPNSEKPSQVNTGATNPGTTMVTVENPKTNLIAQCAEDLVEEVTVKDAAEILGCDKKTVLKYICGGKLEFRDISSPSSTRRNYRVPKTAVLELRNNYSREVKEITNPISPKPRKRRLPASAGYTPKHIRSRKKG